MTWAPLTVLHALDAAAARVDVADDVAHVLLGHDDLDLIMGSSSAGAPLVMASLNAMEPAILNAISEESTSW